MKTRDDLIARVRHAICTTIDYMGPGEYFLEPSDIEETAHAAIDAVVRFITEIPE